MNIKSKYFDFYDFKVEQFIFRTIPLEENSRVKLKSLPYSIDFDVLMKNDSEQSNNKHLEFVIRIKIQINPEKKPGYFISAIFISFFRLRNFRKLNKDIINQYIIFTALPMSINSIRMQISAMTSRGIYGEYFLPPVDLQALLLRHSK